MFPRTGDGRNQRLSNFIDGDSHMPSVPEEIVNVPEVKPPQISGSVLFARKSF